MKHGKNTLRLMALLAAALMLLMLCGCSRGMIKEDSVHEDLPDIDPEAGIAKDMRAKLYYRLTDEAYLVGVTATITVYAGEREERAMIRTLMEGTPPLSGNISAVIPAGTEIVDVSLEGAILYVTLSAEFFNTNIVDEAVADGSRLMENGLLAKSVGMLTDSRSFSSFPRHEYYRRILCQRLGELAESGQYPADEAKLGKIVENVCGKNAAAFLYL